MAYTVEPILGLRIQSSGDTDGDWAANLEYNNGLLAAAFATPGAWPTAPALCGDTTNPTVSYSTSHAGYVLKRGKEIQIDGILSISTISGGTGSAFITLPYAASAIANLAPVISLCRIGYYNSTMSDLFNLALRVIPGQAKAYFTASGITSGQQLQPISCFVNNFIAHFSGRYWID